MVLLRRLGGVPRRRGRRRHQGPGRGLVLALLLVLAGVGRQVDARGRRHEGRLPARGRLGVLALGLGLGGGLGEVLVGRAGEVGALEVLFVAVREIGGSVKN